MIDYYQLEGFIQEGTMIRIDKNKHINGNLDDHRKGNLRFLCPNCHSQTNTYRGKNMKRGKMVVGGES